MKHDETIVTVELQIPQWSADELSKLAEAWGVGQSLTVQILVADADRKRFGAPEDPAELARLSREADATPRVAEWGPTTGNGA